MEEHVGKKSLCLVKESSASIYLSNDHAFYYQVQGQLSCTDYMWCDFVIMTHCGHIFIERITSDESFWAHLVRHLSRFYKQFMFVSWYTYTIDLTHLQATFLFQEIL